MKKNTVREKERTLTRAALNRLTGVALSEAGFASTLVFKRKPRRDQGEKARQREQQEQKP